MIGHEVLGSAREEHGHYDYSIASYSDDEATLEVVEQGEAYQDRDPTINTTRPNKHKKKQQNNGHNI